MGYADACPVSPGSRTTPPAGLSQRSGRAEPRRDRAAGRVLLDARRHPVTNSTTRSTTARSRRMRWWPSHRSSRARLGASAWRAALPRRGRPPCRRVDDLNGVLPVHRQHVEVRHRPTDERFEPPDHRGANLLREAERRGHLLGGRESLDARCHESEPASQLPSVTRISVMARARPSSFGLDNVEYEIDVSKANADTLRQACRPTSRLHARSGGRRGREARVARDHDQIRAISGVGNTKRLQGI